nr:TonB-dependent receptor [uncultured Rhodoferax sp.]
MSTPQFSPAAATTILPLGAMLLAGSFSAIAQENTSTPVKSLKPVTITEKLDEEQGKDSVRATSTSIGKGKQELRDIPQSITVVTEKLMDDRAQETLKDVLHNTAGVSFQAAEGGEEDIRLRGFSLAATGDIFLDGMRDPAYYDRDTFNHDRVELLRGSASMLFGRGSTGGAANQVSKVARAIDQSEVTTALGSYNYGRVTGDFNIKTDEDAGLRINTMVTKADNNGAGAKIDKKGVAANYRFGIGTTDEYSIGLYSLENKNGMNLGVPWLTVASGSDERTMLNVNPSNNYGLASDYNKSTANHLTFAHTHRFADDSELKTQIRNGVYTRDVRTDTLSYAAGTNATNVTNSTVLNHSNNNSRNKIQDFHGTYAQSDYSKKLTAWGLKHELLTGVDFAIEAKNTYAPTGTTAKASTTVGTPNTDASYDESSRQVGKTGAFTADNIGVYAQDLVQVAEHWKVLGGLRYDRMRGSFASYTPATGALSAEYGQTVGDWSKRLGFLYQPTQLSSYHFSYGTSFNTSADTYSYAANTANAAPEQSRNIEFGAKLDSADSRFTTRWAIFHSTKYNERNTDPDSASATQLLSGRRSTAGIELDVTGMLSSKWEVYGSYMWMPHARVDAAAPCPPLNPGQQCAQTANSTNAEGSRPGLTPVHSGTVWSTYQFTPEFRFGGGINFRSEQYANTSRSVYTRPYATLDLMTEYKFSEKVTLKGNLINVTDKLYADAVYNGHYLPGSGRNLQASLNVKF